MMPNIHTAAAPAAEPTSFAFGRYILHPRHRRLLAGDRTVALGSRAFDILVMLVESSGKLVTKDAILDGVWPDVAVEENSLQVQVAALRRALGPERDCILTIPGRGYCFTAPVSTQPIAIAVEDAPTVSSPATTRAPSHLSLLVLPFACRGDDPAKDWFADSITDSLTTDLVRAVSGSAVIAQVTADTYKGHPADARAIGRDQAVRYVVEGSVLRTGDQVRVNVQLIDAGSGVHLWAERFDKSSSHGMLQVQDEIVGRVVRSLGLQMVGADARRAEQAEQQREDEGTVQDYVLRGRAVTNQRMLTRESLEVGCALYERALAREAENADALAGIAHLRIYQVMLTSCAGSPTMREQATREMHLAEAEEKLSRASIAAPDHLEVLKCRILLLRAQGAFEEAIATAGTVCARAPGDPMTYHEIASSCLYLGRMEEAVEWFQRADALAPGDPLRWTWLQGLGRALVQVGRNADAVGALRLAVASNPNFAPGHALLAAALALAGENAPAQTAMSAFRRLEPAMPFEAIARCSAVPFEATHSLYKSRNERVLDGLHRAARLG